MVSFQNLFNVMSTGNCGFSSLPKPRGPNTIATDVVLWRDTQVRIWYPTDQSQLPTDAKVTEYTTTDYIKHMAQVYKMPQLLISYCFNTLTNSFSRKDHESPTIPLKQSEEKYPVIVFSHGLMGLPEHYTAICEELCSNGYIVAAPYHSDSSCPAVIPARIYADNDSLIKPILYDEKREAFMNEQRDLCDKSDETTLELLYREFQLTIRVDNIRTCLDVLHKLSNSDEEETKLIPGAEILRDKIDSNRIGMLGHSFGGGTAAAACISTTGPAQFACGMSLDGWLDPLVNDIVRPTEKKTFVEQMLESRKRQQLRPFAFVNSQLWQWKNNLKSMDRILEGISQSEFGENTVQEKVYKYQMKGTHHHNFDDIAVLMPTLGKYMNYVGPDIDPVSHMSQLTDTIKSYFDYHMPSPSLNNKDGMEDPLKEYLFKGCPSDEEASVETYAEPPTISELINDSSSWRARFKDVPLIKHMM